MFKNKINDNVKVSVFSIPNGKEEFYFSVNVKRIEGKDFQYHLKIALDEYSDAINKLDVSHESVVLLKIFVDEFKSQSALIKKALSLRFKSGIEEVPITIVEQPPLSGSAISILAYHIRSQFHIKKKKLHIENHENINCNSYMVELGNHRYVWLLNLADERVLCRNQADLQSRTLFNCISEVIRQNNGKMDENLLRTWIYVDDIDNNYKMMDKGRQEVFFKEGLTPKTHFVASTGIGGRMSFLSNSIVSINALSIFGLRKEQIRYIKSCGSMNSPIEYNIAFERATVVEYGDRTHIYVSGTASIDNSGQVLYIGDIVKQTEKTFSNIESLLECAGASISDLAFIIVYVRNPDDDDIVKKITDNTLTYIPYVLVHGPVCRPDWLVEIEGIAVLKNRNPRFNNF